MSLSPAFLFAGNAQPGSDACLGGKDLWSEATNHKHDVHHQEAIMNQRRTTITLLFAFFAACGGNGDMDKLKKLKDRACECTDVACTKAVSDDLKALSSLKGNKDAESIVKELRVCMQNAIQP